MYSQSADVFADADTDADADTYADRSISYIRIHYSQYNSLKNKNTFLIVGVVWPTADGIFQRFICYGDQAMACMGCMEGNLGLPNKSVDEQKLHSSLSYTL